MYGMYVTFVSFDPVLPYIVQFNSIQNTLFVPEEQFAEVCRVAQSPSNTIQKKVRMMIIFIIITAIKYNNAVYTVYVLMDISIIYRCVIIQRTWDEAGVQREATQTQGTTYRNKM